MSDDPARERLVEVLDEKHELMKENAFLKAALREIAGARNWCGTERDTAIYWRFADMADAALTANEREEA